MLRVIGFVSMICFCRRAAAEWGYFMEFKDIKQLAELMKDTGLTSLEYAEGGANLKMERCGGNLPVTAVAAETPASTVEAKAETSSDLFTVTSPMVGVFYSAPSPDVKPYVSIGDAVKAGDILCIIEAMKMMNEITAEQEGTVVEICVGNKQIVEYGHPLFRIKKA
jgi:acetyl-CoA carboxylase biotin carboxyl carrier protein